MVLRDYLLKRYQKRVQALPLQEDHQALKRSAIVFAPHQDDETLACGGTILRKKAQGAEVRLVFLTDGGGSHTYWMPPEKMRQQRKQEAFACAQSLGLHADEVTFLRFPDGQLSQHVKDAAGQALNLLERFRPQEIFLPHRGEPPADHVAANQAVMAALTQLGNEITLYEYPVWYWYHWPWVNLIQKKRRDTLLVIQQTLRAAFGLRLFKQFNLAINITPVMDGKRAALEQYCSQMSHLVPDPNWPTLQDVSNGQWLDCFFQGRELFYRWRFNPSISR